MACQNVFFSREDLPKHYVTKICNLRFKKHCKILGMLVKSSVSDADEHNLIILVICSSLRTVTLCLISAYPHHSH